jgi:hypothetical protein
MTVTYPHFLKKSVTRFKALVISIAICIKCMLDSSIMRGNVYAFILFKVYMLNNTTNIVVCSRCSTNRAAPHVLGWPIGDVLDVKLTTDQSINE